MHKDLFRALTSNCLCWRDLRMDELEAEETHLPIAIHVQKIPPTNNVWNITHSAKTTG